MLCRNQQKINRRCCRRRRALIVMCVLRVLRTFSSPRYPLSTPNPSQLPAVPPTMSGITNIFAATSSTGPLPPPLNAPGSTASRTSSTASRAIRALNYMQNGHRHVDRPRRSTGARVLFALPQAAHLGKGARFTWPACFL